MSRARWRGIGAARHRSRPPCIPCSTSTSVPVASVPQDIAWGYYCLANVSVTCRWYLVTRCLLLDAGFGVYQHITIVEVPKPFQSIKSCYNVDPPFYKGVPQPETLDQRLIINMPPRHTKSEFSSFLLPAWMIGRRPKLKIIQSTHTTELAVRFGRKAKNLMDSQEYKEVFETRLREDSQAAGKWETEQGGEYYAAGVGSAITGRGADLLIIDDPHSEQDALNIDALERAYEWYTSGPRQRLQPGGAIVLVMTRWNTKDLTGALLRATGDTKSDKWELIEFPAILPSGKPVWPEYWKLEELEGVKASLTLQKWNAQWMQNPTSEEGAIIKREWWRKWDKDYIPPLEHVIQSYDTAFMKKQTADYSAITTWGVFYIDEDSGPQLILLDSIKDRFEFPELRRIAYQQYQYWQPESVLVEAKASGLPLTYELRKMGIPVINFTPSKGNDKHSRVNAVAPLFESGQIWAPTHKEFAQEVIEECAAFPYGDHDDLVDSMTQAVMRFRQGGFVEHPEDYKDEALDKRKRNYY
jgi:predicted phage terminase large subunit-like protein